MNKRLIYDMHIYWHGLSCVRIQTQDAMLLINPYQDKFGLKMPSLKVDVVASTKPDDDQANNFGRLQGDPMIICNPGEYEKSGMIIYGVPQTEGRSMYVIDAEGITLGHPGISPPELTDEQLKQFEGVDVLFLPLTCESNKICSTLLSQIEPRIIIPIQYKIPKVKLKLNDLDRFAKELGKNSITGEKKVILKKKDLPVDETRMIVLDPS
ncbi:MAG: MBL fold metallo-hydrolase [Candidatus Kerfeldbacteria bacterium]